MTTKAKSKTTQKEIQPSAHDLFGTNSDLEAGAGVKMDYGPFAVIIHRAGGSNKKYGRVLNEKMKPHRGRFERGLLDDETSEQILLEAFVEGVVVGWSGNIGPGGKKAKFSVENCIQVFKELPDLYTDLRDKANDVSTFQKENEEIELKN